MKEFSWAYVMAGVVFGYLMYQMNDKKPFSTATRAEMDAVFLEEAPEDGMDTHQVLDFVKEFVKNH